MNIRKSRGPNTEPCFFVVNSWSFAVETVEYSLEVPLSIYRFEKVCFSPENAKLAS